MANDQALDTLQIDIQASGVSAADGIQKLADAIRHLRTAVGRDGSKLGNFSKALSDINTAVGRTNYDKIMSVAASLSRLANSLNMVHGASAQSFQNVVKRIEKLEGTVTKSAESVEKMKESLNGGWGGQGHSDPIKETLDGITESAEEAQEEAAKERGEQSVARGTHGSATRAFATIRKGLLNLLNFAKKIGLSISKALIAPLRLVGKAIGELAGKFRDLAIKGITLPFRAISGMANKITNFIRAIGRIALYRAIRSAIKAVTQGLQEGIQNLYQWSLLMDHTFANSMDSIATSMQYLHNGFAAMFSPLIEYAAPILEEITNKVVDFFNIIQQIFATLTGQTTWHKAIRVQKQYGDQIAETGQAAEKAMHQLMAFDELNVINSPSAGGSGGSGQQTPDYGSMFTTEEVDTELTSWVQDIMDFFNSGEFYNLGKYVAEKLNVLVDQWNAYGDGFKFGEKIRHALETFNGFLENFEFADLGEKVAEWFIGLWDGVNPATVIQFFRNVLTAIRDFVSGFIGRIIKEWEARTGLSFDEFGKWLAGKLNYWVNQWKSYEGGFTFGQKIQKILNQLNDFLREFDFVSLGSKVGDWIAGFVDGLTPEVIGDAIANAINSALSFVSGLAIKLNDKGVPEKIGRAIGIAFAAVKWEDVGLIFQNIVKGAAKLFNSAMSTFVDNGGPDKIKTALGNIGTAIGQAFATISWTDVAGVINGVATGIGNLLKNGLEAFTNEGGWQNLWDGLTSLSPEALGLLTVTFGFKLASGAKTLIEAITGSLGIAGATSGAGLFTVGATGLMLALTIAAYLDWKNGDPPTIPDLEDERIQAIMDSVSTLQQQYMAGGAVVGGKPDDGERKPSHGYLPTSDRYPDFTKNNIIDSSETGKNINKAIDFIMDTSRRSYDMEFEYMTEAMANVISDGFKESPDSTSFKVSEKMLRLLTDMQAHHGDTTDLFGVPEYNGNITSDMFLNYLGGPDLAKQHMRKMIADMETEVTASTLPAKIGALGTKGADMLKNGVKNANIPKVFDDEATVSATKFGTHDFSPGGLHAGEGIKLGAVNAKISDKFAEIREGALDTWRKGDYEGNGREAMTRTGNGMDTVNLPQKMATVAASMIHSMRWAGWEGAFDQIGAVSGDHYKAAFKSHAQATLMLQSAAGAPITQSYIVPYANGGFPSQGSLFWAGEVAGQTELMGTINGRTGVASGREITGISDAVYATGNEEASLLRQTNILLQALLAKDPFGTPNSNAGRWITQSQQAYKAVKG